MTKLPMKVASIQLTVWSLPILIASVYFTVMSALALLSSLLSSSVSLIVTSLIFLCVTSAFTWSLVRVQIKAIECGTKAINTPEVFVNVTVFMCIAGFLTALFF